MGVPRSSSRISNTDVRKDQHSELEPNRHHGWLGFLLQILLESLLLDVATSIVSPLIPSRQSHEMASSTTRLLLRLGLSPSQKRRNG